MTDLSPQAQAIVDACLDENCGDNLLPSELDIVAAALRAAADLVVPEEQEPSVLEMQMWARISQRQRTRSQLLAIAAELEGTDV